MNGYESVRCRKPDHECFGKWHIRFMRTGPETYAQTVPGEPMTFPSKKTAEVVRRRLDREMGTSTRADAFVRRGRVR